MENSSDHLPQEQCPLTLDGAVEYEMRHGRLFNDPNMDLKKIRRLLSNRISAQRYRIKMVNYTCDLKTTVDELERLISIFTPQVESYKEKIKLLQVESHSLRQQLDKRSSESKLLEVAIEQKRAEIKMQKELERTADKNKLSADSEGKETPALRLGPLRVVPYPCIHIYQICLKNQQTNPSSAVIVQTAPDSTTEQSGKEIEPAAKEVETMNQENEDIYQYIDFDVLNAEFAPDGGNL